MVKQTSHVHNRSHEGACHCMIHMSDLKTLKFTGIAAPIEELIIEQQRKKKNIRCSTSDRFGNFSTGALLRLLAPSSNRGANH